MNLFNTELVFGLADGGGKFDIGHVLVEDDRGEVRGLQMGEEAVGRLFGELVIALVQGVGEGRVLGGVQERDGAKRRVTVFLNS